MTKSDSDFLANLGLMDYSLLLGIEKIESDGNEGSRVSSKIMSEKHCYISDSHVYHISIIDFLQEWNFSKKGERWMKTVLLGKDAPTLSAIEPIQYGARFKKFAEQNIFIKKN